MIADLQTVLAWIERIREQCEALLQYSETLNDDQRRDITSMLNAALRYYDMADQFPALAEHLQTLPPHQALKATQGLDFEWVTALNILTGFSDLLLAGVNGDLAAPEQEVIEEIYGLAQAASDWTITGR